MNKEEFTANRIEFTYMNRRFCFYKKDSKWVLGPDHALGLDSLSKEQLTKSIEMLELIERLRL